MKCTPLLTTAFVILLLSLGTVLAPNIFADAPLVINYQGRLTDSSGDPVPDGDYSLTFSIWDDSIGGQQLWTETHSSVPVTSGMFIAQLGSTTTIEVKVLRIEMVKSGQTALSGRYLEIQVGSSTPLTPRTPLDFVPFSGIARAVSGDFMSAPGEILLIDTTTGDTTIFVSSNSTRSEIGINEEGVNRMGMKADTSGSSVYINGFGTFIVKRYVSPDTISLLEMGADSLSSQLHIADLDDDGNIDLVVNSDQSSIILAKKKITGLVWMESVVDTSGPSITMVDSNDVSINKLYLKKSGLRWVLDDYSSHDTVVQIDHNDNKARIYLDLDTVATELSTDGLILTKTDLPTAITDTSAEITSNGNAYFSGSVGIGLGTSSLSSNILTVVQNSTTDPIADAWTTYSSRRWKTNIKTIDKALEKVQNLRGVTYQWKKDGKDDIGLIAEEVGKVIPEIVVYEENGKDAKSVDYARLVALLIEAVKEQQNTITAMQKKLIETEILKADIVQLTAIVKTLLAEQNKSKTGNDKLAISYKEEQ